MSTKELFFEIGTEEIPAGFIPRAMAEMKAIIKKELTKARLEFGEIETVATPRRLVLFVRAIPTRQPDAEITAMGPSVKAAYDADGKPTKAAEGFARGQGVDVSDLLTITNDKGEYLSVIKKETGRPTNELLASILPKLINDIPFQKSMRWGNQDVRFARPIHWIVALFGETVIPFSFGNIISGNSSRGHRFMANSEFSVTSFNQYLEECKKHYIIVDPEERKKIIRRETEKLAKQVGGVLLEDEELLEQVAYLVEYPSAVHGTFSPEFLKVPREVLITSMKSHQRYFSIEDQAGNLMPSFITINNTVAPDPTVVIKGNERVLRARLSDARFFFDEDKKIKLDERVKMLKKVVYQQKLGTSYEKMERFRTLAESVATELNPEIKSDVSRAATLCKADLVSGMVGEFPEVQGIMGREYALLQGEKPSVANAIAEHYLPNQAGGQLPSSDIGAFVSIADKLDTICGCFGVGLIPTGSADPYALRRSALGIINIIIDRRYRLSLTTFIDEALSLLSAKLKRPASDVKGDMVEFFKGRFVNLMGDRYPTDVVDAVVAAGFDDLLDAKARIEALATFHSRPDFSELSVTFKRVGNIVKDGVDLQVDALLFQDAAENELYAELQKVESSVLAAVAKRDYLAALTDIATLRSPVDNFFDKVMVMAEEENVRQNRLAMLTSIARLFGGIADFARLG